MSFLTMLDKILSAPAQPVFWVAELPLDVLVWSAKKAWRLTNVRSAVPAVPDPAKDRERAYRQKVAAIQRLPLGEEEKRDLLTAAEAEYLRAASRVME